MTLCTTGAKRRSILPTPDEYKGVLAGEHTELLELHCAARSHHKPENAACTYLKKVCSLCSQYAQLVSSCAYSQHDRAH